MRFIATPIKAGLSALAIAMLLLSTLAFTRVDKAKSATGPDCGSGYSLLVGDGSNSNVVGTTNIILATPSSSPTITKVIFRANGQPLGKAKVSGTYSWSMPWVTSLLPPGSVSLDAEVYLSGSTSNCSVSGYTVNLNNPQTSDLVITPTPSDWDGPISYSFPISTQVKTINPDLDVTPYSLFYWTTSIGSIGPSSTNTAQFTSGQTVGSGNVTIKARYGGRDMFINVPINVLSSEAPLPSSTTEDTSTSTTTTDDSSTETTSITELRESTLQNNPVAQDCITTAIGKARFDAINSGKERPTLEEIKKFTACFASSNYILPSNFAPVAPEAIKTLQKSEKASINPPTNANKQKDDASVDVLVLSGKAAPNSIVLIYIFSDPLVLTTTTNENGEWTYTLEDPIEPGNHEVYSVVDRGDGVYERTDPLSFVIQTAEAADANPAGLSLKLADNVTPAQSNRSLILYAAASSVVILLVAVTMLAVIRRRSRKALAGQTPQMSVEPQVQDENQQSSENNNPPVA